ncbi:putative MobA-like protein [Galbibacter orientalis DSM 19592]|uniref:Putative MobA-like protein n=1 Tax=Galbibacter orientalis DSM 19592 TaxID=926559 RepID=I3C1Z7_9FLAO|nr:nucleotidyltransferase family protein [Galbibacter orientalis]EIJ37640.1 putative MobA-like protein [Galbibacter orientalis DSM 19592]
MKKVAILILSAGASKRMGTPKQLLKWGEETLLENAVSTAVNVENTSLFVVLGANAELIQQKITLNAEALYHKDWEQGLGSSIAFGVRTLQKLDFDGVLIMLADQPFVTSYYLKELINSFNSGEKNIIASRFAGSVGVPAIFSAEYFEDLKKLDTDTGAKHIIKAHFQDVETFQADDLVIDIDTVETYKRAYKIKFNTD